MWFFLSLRVGCGFPEIYDTGLKPVPVESKISSKHEDSFAHLFVAKHSIDLFQPYTGLDHQTMVNPQRHLSNDIAFPETSQCVIGFCNAPKYRVFLRNNAKVGARGGQGMEDIYD